MVGLGLAIVATGCVVTDEADCTSDDDCASGEQCVRGGGLFVRDGVCVGEAFDGDVGPPQDADVGPSQDADVCTDGEMRCGDECVDIISAVDHCGSCDNRCDNAPEGAEPICDHGVCSFECVEEDDKACNGECVDINTDDAHCGACGNSCEIEGGTATCDDGLCTVEECDDAYVNCAEQTPDGQPLCADLDDHPEHCGDCGRDCGDIIDIPDNGIALCDEGECDWECNEGYWHCAGDCIEACDDYPANATPLCVDGACGWECNEGFAECDGQCILDDEPCCLPDYDGDFGGGEGTDDDPYLLCDPTHIEELDALSTGQHFLQTTDLDLDGVNNALPIGSSSLGFNGTFDGGGYELTNLSVDSGESSTGVFTALGTAGTIRDLTISSLDVVGADKVGGLVGFNEGTITGVTVEGSVSGDEQVGGLVGVIAASGVVEESAAAGDVSGIVDVGGLVGAMEACTSDDADGCSSGHIRDSYTTSDVEAEIRSGGLVGRITGCEQIRTSTFGDGTGICSSPKVYDSFATGHLDGDERGAGLVALIEGCKAINEGPSFLAGPECNSPRIVHSYSTGVVGMLFGDSNSGGLIGETTQCVTDGSNSECDDPDISNSYWDVDTSGQTNSDGGQGLTTPEFSSPSNFAGWDFADLWEIGVAPDGEERPMLQWVD